MLYSIACYMAQWLNVAIIRNTNKSSESNIFHALTVGRHNPVRLDFRILIRRTNIEPLVCVC